MPATELQDVQLAGNVAYVSHMSGLLILDVSNAAQPKELGRYDAGSVPHSRVQLVGHYALLGCGGMHSGDTIPGVDVIDVRDPTKPARGDRYGAVGEGRAFQLMAGRLHLGGDNGLHILDAELPSLRLAPPVLSASALTLTWTGGPGIRLQMTTSLTGPDWQEVARSDGVSQLELPRTEAGAFFRLIQQ